MAVYKGRTEEIPEGAIKLTEEQVREYHFRLIYGWEPKGEVWPFRYGLGLLGGLSALSAIYINNHYRTRLRLFSYGRVSSYLPIVVLPAVMSTVFHQSGWKLRESSWCYTVRLLQNLASKRKACETFTTSLFMGFLLSFTPENLFVLEHSIVQWSEMVTADILVKRTRCPVCVELRASALQVFFSTIYPVVLAPIGGLTMATRYFTYKVPDITTDPKGAFRILLKFTKPIGTILGGIAILQAVAASWITHCEADAFHRVQAALLESEKERDFKD